MVKSATSLTRNGLVDWLLQRLSAIIIGAYTIFLLGYIALHPHMDYVTWTNLFQNELMRVATILVLIAISVHAYIGLWTVSTDYLTKCSVLRIFFQACILVILIVLMIWGSMILWG